LIVVDASVVLDLLFRTPDAAELEARLFDSGEALAAPDLIDLEVAQVLRRATLRGELAPGRGEMSLDLLAQFPIRRYSHEPLLPRIWALRANLTAYDAAYVTLAEALDAVLLTRDARLAGARGHVADIEVV
jgi:predicted nucleic acid-binding protein